MTDPRTHAWNIDPHEYARHEARRGRQHAYEQLDPYRTALVVIDMVPFFAADNRYVWGILPNINLLAGQLREVGGMVAWVVPRVSEAPSAWAREFYGPQVAVSFNVSGGLGELRGRLMSELDTHPDDLNVEKTSSSAFFPGKCPLPELLHERGVDTVLIAGTVTNVCCESSARDAATLGFRVVMLADACAAGSDAVHNATLHTIYRSFGDVRPVGDLLNLLRNA